MVFSGSYRYIQVSSGNFRYLQVSSAEIEITGGHWSLSEHFGQMAHSSVDMLRQQLLHDVYRWSS